LASLLPSAIGLAPDERIELKDWYNARGADIDGGYVEFCVDDADGWFNSFVQGILDTKLMPTLHRNPRESQLHKINPVAENPIFVEVGRREVDCEDYDTVFDGRYLLIRNFDSLCLWEVKTDYSISWKVDLTEGKTVHSFVDEL
jgi:hypothetical protein